MASDYQYLPHFLYCQIDRLPPLVSTRIKYSQNKTSVTFWGAVCADVYCALPLNQ